MENLIAQFGHAVALLSSCQSSVVGAPAVAAVTGVPAEEPADAAAAADPGGDAEGDERGAPLTPPLRRRFASRSLSAAACASDGEMYCGGEGEGRGGLELRRWVPPRAGG